MRSDFWIRMILKILLIVALLICFCGLGFFVVMILGALGIVK